MIMVSLTMKTEISVDSYNTWNEFYMQFKVIGFAIKMPIIIKNINYQ